MTLPALKRQRVSNLRLDEISSVDVPAVAGATACLMKRADGADATFDAAIRKSAAAVADGARPAYGVEEYEDAMLRRADELARDWRTTPEQAMMKHLTKDQTLRDLAHAAEHARVDAYGAAVAKRRKAAAAL